MGVSNMYGKTKYGGVRRTGRLRDNVVKRPRRGVVGLLQLGRGPGERSQIT